MKYSLFSIVGFIQATSLHIHLRTHASHERSDDPKFMCSVCGKGFKRLNPYKVHLKKHCDDKVEEQKNSQKIMQEFCMREHVCEVCKRAYKTKYLLKAHLLTHGEKTFLCSDCGKGFVTKAALQSHLKVHTGEKPHTCSFCKKSFAHLSSFDAHMLIHMGQKPYQLVSLFRLCYFFLKMFITDAMFVRKRLRNYHI